MSDLGPKRTELKTSVKMGRIACVASACMEARLGIYRWRRPGLKKLRLETRRFWSAGHACKAKKQGARHLWIGVSQAVVYIPPFSDFVVFITLHQWMHAPISSLITAYRGPALTVAMKGHGATKRGPAAHAGIREGPRYAQMGARNVDKGNYCDGNQPCSPCAKNGITCLPLLRRVPRPPRQVKAKQVVAPIAPIAPTRQSAILPRPSSPSHPPPTPYQPPDNICESCKNDGIHPDKNDAARPVASLTSSARGHGRESPAEASTSSSLQEKASPTSPSSPPESPLSPYSHQSPHNHAAVCVPDADLHNSGSQGHNPPTPTPSPSPMFPTQPYLFQPHSTSLHDRNTMVRMATPTLDPHGMRLCSEDYEESPGSSMSPLSPDPLQVPSASLYRTTAHPVEPRLYSDGDAQRPVSPASCYPSQRRHSGSYETPTVSDESAPALSPLGMDSHPQDELSPASSSLSHPPQSNPTASSSHSTTSSADPLARHPYYGDAFHHDVGAASGSQPLQRSLPFTSPLTRPQVIHEPPKVTLPSFAEAFPEFVGSSLSNLRAGGRIVSYPG
ncbi:hypothetical protein BU17DRAFT_98780 [Hysterangium stoloniferum]|nr:hypothetical protein BU17DRAFT_98780 [Hysterangium stoloniferum]